MHLCRKDLIESRKSHVLRLVLMYGMLVLAFYWNGLTVYSENLSYTMEKDQALEFVQVAFFIFAFIFGSIGASFVMERMKRKTSCVSVLMTPVTPFEYFLSRWMVYVAVFIPVYLTVFVGADFTRVLIFSSILPDVAKVVPFTFSDLVTNMGSGVSSNSAQGFGLMISLYLLVQSCFVLGSTLWPKNAFLKTFAVGVICVLLYVICYNTIVEASGKSFLPGDELPAGYTTLVLLLVAVFNWVLAYYRFKESEIINRM